MGGNRGQPRPCGYCGTRCRIRRMLPSGEVVRLSTCSQGAVGDRKTHGYDHLTAANPVTGLPACGTATAAWAAFYEATERLAPKRRGSSAA